MTWNASTTWADRIESAQAQYQAQMEAEDQEMLRRDGRCADPDGYLTHDPDDCGSGHTCKRKKP